MNTRSKNLYMLAALFSALSLSACGGGGGNSTPPTAANTAAAPEAGGSANPGAAGGATSTTAGGGTTSGGAAGTGAAGSGGNVGGSAGGGTGSGTSTAGSGGSTPTGTDVVTAAGTLQIAVPTAIYPIGSPGISVLNGLNLVRHLAGAGLLSQSPPLDTAAAAHTNYLIANGAASNHDEDPAAPRFYEVLPQARIAKAGFAAGYSAEVISVAGTLLGSLTGSDCLQQLLNSVYKAVTLLGQATHVGFGFGANFATTPLCVGNLATQSTDAYGQVPRAGALVGYPYPGQDDVPASFNVDFDSPRPSPVLFPNTSAGTPIIVGLRNADFLNYRAAGSLHVVVSQFALTDEGGNAVPAAILANASLQSDGGLVLNADPNLPEATVVLVPLSPLLRNHRYSVAFSATLKTGAAPLAKAWYFTTMR